MHGGLRQPSPLLHLCRLGALALTFLVGVVLQFLGCALYSNWWPMLTGVVGGTAVQLPGAPAACAAGSRHAALPRQLLRVGGGG